MAQEQSVNPMDSIEIGLITCSPHEEIYSLYGHSALRYHDLRTDYDVAFNWGVFNFDTPHFVLRFVFGLTDYELAPVPFKDFCKYYQHWGSMVTEQVLNLTPEEKARIALALQNNLKPENRTYRYNYFYDNCSTRPRDMIERNLTGELVYKDLPDQTPTYRQMVGEHTRNHPWATVGNDLLLGIKADFKTDRRQQEFLPENLFRSFSGAQIYAYGEYRPLVKETRQIVKPGVQIIERDFIFTPIECGIMLMVLALLILLLEWKRKTVFRWWDALLMLLQGLAGIILFLMIFSQHPTTSINLQLLLLNPIPLFFIWKVIKGRKTVYWQILVGMTCLFLIGGLWQHYAEGMYFVALCLLTRYWSNIRYTRK